MSPTLSPFWFFHDSQVVLALRPGCHPLEGLFKRQPADNLPAVYHVTGLSLEAYLMLFQEPGLFLFLTVCNLSTLVRVWQIMDTLSVLVGRCC